MKVVGKILALESYQKSFTNCFPLDLTAFIHVFHLKERFSNFKRSARRQKLLYNRGIITIKGWGEVTLLLKIRNRTSIFALKNVTYITDFLLNFVLLTVLKDQGFI